MTLNNSRTDKCRAYFNDLILTEIEGLGWVAGGAIRAWYAIERQTDIDLFFKDATDMQKALDIVLKNGGTVVFENDNVKKVAYKKKTLDFCLKYFSNAEETIDNFDFTVSMGAVTVANSHFGADFFMDLSSRRLAINKLPFPISTLSRIQKYTKKGYWICKGELFKIVLAINKLEMKVDNTQTSTILEDSPESDNTGFFAGMD